MHTAKIREATLNDLPVLRAFEQGIIEAERPFEPQLKSEQIHYYDLETLITAEHVHLVVVELDGIAIGSGYVRIEKAKPYLKYNFKGYVGFIYVVAEQRGKGIVKLILSALEEWSSMQGVEALHLDVFSQNASAIRAYEKFGFKANLIDMRKMINVE
ncbi:GNAT family N-acetyltransferase [Thalassotalea marina]|uniref:N-acetyltransferase domain-containing protein n=1 Tax=Thalassotalea marina TaxID=1673741 RepID=A0A919EHA6_9GAMM|nr:GNAT family N-acetyltransferase [Thalassotalea marina]GHF79343.1 hypothetical protein GCM10017161_03150 [Thalassotalea marina]